MYGDQSTPQEKSIFPEGRGSVHRLENLCLTEFKGLKGCVEYARIIRRDTYHGATYCLLTTNKRLTYIVHHRDLNLKLTKTLTFEI